MRLKKYPLPKPGTLKFRKFLSIPALLQRIRSVFDDLPEHRSRKVEYPLPDALMSAVAMFSLKDESLFAFDECRKDEKCQANLNSLYRIKQAPCGWHRYLQLQPDQLSGMLQQAKREW